MKNFAVFFMLIVAFVSCKSEHKNAGEELISLEKSKIETVLDDWHLNAAQTNFDAYFNAMSSSSVFVGTDAAEVWGVKEFKSFSKPYFDKGSAWSFTAVERNIYFNADGKTAWFDELLDTWMGVCRGSGVLSKLNGTWKIEHYVLSITVPNENIKNVIEINKEKDSIFLKNLKK